MSFDEVADTSLIGTLTRPKLTAPLQIALGMGTIQPHRATVAVVAVLVRAERMTPTEKVLGCLLAAAAAELGLLAVTGLFLVFFYRPSAANAWGDLRGVQQSVRFGEVVRIGHRYTAHLMVLTVLAAAGVGMALAISRSFRSRPQKATAAAAVGVALVGLFASFTGYLLPWDQLALWAVTIGSNMMGFMPILRHSSTVQYVLIGGATISVNTLRWWFLIHVVIIPATLVGLGLLTIGRLLRHRDEPDRHTGLGS
jgi:quinol-cytochrome oxidoreductase complex cytochrome b subunit